MVVAFQGMILNLDLLILSFSVVDFLVVEKSFHKFGERYKLVQGDLKLSMSYGCGCIQDSGGQTPKTDW